jgi:hypothetical protein
MFKQALRLFSEFAFCLVALSCARIHAAGFAYPSFSSTSGLNLISSAVQAVSDVRLSPAIPSTAGAMWYTTMQPVQGGFDTTLAFHISEMGGTLDNDGLPGGDGFAFVVQNTSSTALGLINSYMGYEIANSLAVEFDTFRNGNFLAQEPSSNHVGIQSAGVGVNSPFAGQYLGGGECRPEDVRRLGTRRPRFVRAWRTQSVR